MDEERRALVLSSAHMDRAQVPDPNMHVLGRHELRHAKSCLAVALGAWAAASVVYSTASECREEQKLG